MDLPVEAGMGIKPAFVAAQLALRCSVLDRCANKALYNVTHREYATVLQRHSRTLGPKSIISALTPTCAVLEQSSSDTGYRTIRHMTSKSAA
jgi:hypothetical protein